MRKITALILMIALLAVCIVPAFADRPVPDDGYVPKREWRLSNGKGAYYLSQSDNYSDSNSGEGWSWSETGTYSYDGTFGGNKLTQLIWTNKWQGSETYDGETGKYQGERSLRMTGNGTALEWTWTDGEESEHFTFDGTNWVDDDGNIFEGMKEWMDNIAKEILKDYEPEFKWYKNTVCLLGLPIRDLKPGLTDKWYTIVPVDLTHDATYTYPMIAGSIYYLGECQVTVKDGQVTTDFSLPEGLCWDEKHCLQWFTSLDDITTDFLNNPVGAHTFGQPVSIANDLKGQDVALLFICNQAEYRIPLLYSNQCFLTRFYSTQDQVKAAKADMTALLAKIP